MWFAEDFQNYLKVILITEMFNFFRKKKVEIYLMKKLSQK